jgi:hypothetical protein
LSNIDISGTIMTGCFNKNNLGDGSNTIQDLHCEKHGDTEWFSCFSGAGETTPLFDVSYNDTNGWNFALMGDTTASVIQPLFTDFSENTSYCTKYNWAVGNNLSWDSITYGTHNPGYDSNGNSCSTYS